MSDSHGWEEELRMIVDRHKHEVDLLVHCGDSELSSEHPIIDELCIVRGNCDRDANFPDERLEKKGDIAIYITHGHLYNVKMTYVPLSYRAEEMEAKIVCFGHSHIAQTFELNGVVYINPGSIRLPRSPKEKTYCICEQNKNEICVTYYTIHGLVLEDMIYLFPLEA